MQDDSSHLGSSPKVSFSLRERADELAANHSKRELLARAKALQPGVPCGAVPRHGLASMCKPQLAALLANFAFG